MAIARRLGLAGIAAGVCLSLPGLFFTSSLAQDAGAEGADTTKKDAVETERGLVYDHADVMSPVDSFEYWLNSVGMTDAEFTIELRKRMNLDENAAFTAEQLQQEREKAVVTSFDFDAYFEDFEKTTGKESLSPAKREEHRYNMVRSFLSQTRREVYARRNIVATSASPEAPDWSAGMAHVYLELNNTVTGKRERYKVYMRLYEKGLIWRWYKSELVSADEGLLPEATSNESSDIQQRIAELERAIEGDAAQLDVVLAQIAELERASNALKERIRVRSDARDELKRQADPYSTPEASFRTAYKSLKDGTWEIFLNCHSKAIRDVAGEREKENFLRVYRKQHFLGNPSVMEKRDDADNPDLCYLKVKFQITTRKEFDTDTGEDGEAMDVIPLGETRVREFRMVREDNRWLIDEKIAD